MAHSETVFEGVDVFAANGEYSLNGLSHDRGQAQKTLFLPSELVTKANPDATSLPPAGFNRT